jgi:hypothetical protein
MIEVRYGTVRYGTVRYGTVRYGTVRYGTVRYGTVRAVPELITCLSPSHPPDHEVVISLILIQMNKIKFLEFDKAHNKFLFQQSFGISYIIFGIQGPNEFVEVIHLEKEFGPIEFSMTNFVLTRMRNRLSNSGEFNEVHLLKRGVTIGNQLTKDHLEDLWWYQFQVAKVEVVSMLALWLHVCSMF